MARLTTDDVNEELDQLGWDVKHGAKADVWESRPDHYERVALTRESCELRPNEVAAVDHAITHWLARMARLAAIAGVAVIVLVALLLASGILPALAGGL